MRAATVTPPSSGTPEEGGVCGSPNGRTLDYPSGMAGAGLYVRDSGSGPAVLLVHGFPLDGSLWLDQVAALDATRRCLVPDLRGFGQSGPISGHTLTMGSHAADLIRMLEERWIARVDLVALSMGGYAALAFWEARPEMVRSLVLMDTKAAADTDEARANRDATIEKLLADGREAFATSMVDALLGADPSPDAVGRLRTMVESTPYETMVAALRGMRDRKDRSGVLATIDVPTLVVGGAEDRLMPEETTRALGAAIPGAETVIIEGAGHLPPIEQPEATARALVEFLRT